MSATTDSVIDGASMVLGSRKKINPAHFGGFIFFRDPYCWKRL